MAVLSSSVAYAYHMQCSEGQNVNAKASTLKAKAKSWTFEAKAKTIKFGPCLPQLTNVSPLPRAPFPNSRLRNHSLSVIHAYTHCCVHIM